MTTYPSMSKRWMVTHIPPNFRIKCPVDFDDDIYLQEVLVLINLAESPYQLSDCSESTAVTLDAYLGVDENGLEQTEYLWYLVECIVGDAVVLYPYVKPHLKPFENAEGFGVNIYEAHVDPLLMMFTFEEV